MNENELRRKSRSELCELLLAEMKKTAGLESELSSVRLQLADSRKQAEELNARLEDKKVQLEEAGSIADASLKLTAVFTEAQSAAQIYLDSIADMKARQEEVCRQKELESTQQAEELLAKTKSLSQKALEEMKDRCSRMLQEASDKCSKDLEETKALCEKTISDTDATCEAAKEAAKAEMESYWESLSGRLEDFYQAHLGMRDLMSFYNFKLPTMEKPE